MEGHAATGANTPALRSPEEAFPVPQYRRTGLLVAVLTLALAAVAGSTPAWRSFSGAWFRVKVPPGFRVEAREMRMEGDSKRFDGVSCKSPDGKAEFYVYSPQWSGTPKWIALRAGEKRVGSSVEESEQRKVTYVTLKGNGYTRSYADAHGKQDGTRTVFGFQYRDQATYKKYRSLYLQFKKSLTQFAD
jgi:hypothetical protein